jgi:MSHA biogenesis protein MshN
MSLINQMLQDLARRQAPDAGTLGHIAPVQIKPQRRTLPAWVWVAAFGIVGANALFWLWWHQYANRPQLHAAPLAHVSKPVAPAIAASVPAPNTTPASAPAHTPDPLAAIALPAQIAPALAMTLALTQPDASPAAIQPEKPAEPVQTAPVVINKQVKPLTSVQLAENEYRKALALAQQGRTDAAMDGFGQALTLDPHHHSARLTLVGLLIENKRSGEAEQHLQQGLALDADQTDMAMILARLQVDRGSVNDAIATLERSLPYAAEQADYQAFLAALLQRAGHPKQAIEHYIVALGKSPQSGVWWMGLGISLQADNQPDKAREAFIRAKSSNSLSPELLAFVNQRLNAK